MDKQQVIQKTDDWVKRARRFKILGGRSHMNWKVITDYSFRYEDVIIKNEKLLRKFGVRLHHRPEIQSYEFRMAYFEVIISGPPGAHRTLLKIPIPFMRRDFFIVFGRGGNTK